MVGKKRASTGQFHNAVLFNLDLGELHGAFETRFPHFPYARYDSEVYIPSLKGISKVPKLLDLVAELGLTCTVIGLEPGGPAID